MRPTVQALLGALEPGPRRLLAAAVAAANMSGANLWLVGGPVRDLAAGLAVRDLDFATDRDAAALASSLATHVRGIVHVEARFGTARVDVAGYRVDFAALRTETYARPGALPSVRLGATLEADLGRRDFTVNAMALGVAGPVRGRLADPHDGLHDLASRRLRVLHANSFRDDATRLWRAARFAARLVLRPDRGTARLITEGVYWLDAISAHRLWREFALVANEPRVAEAIQTLDRWGVLDATHPALALGPEARRALRRRRRAFDPDVLFALLVAQRPPADRAAASTRIGAPRSASRAAEDAARLLALSSDAPTDLDAVAGSSEVARLAALLLDPARQRALQGALRRWERTRPPLDARALLALGVPQGPAVGATLAWLRRERYVGNLDGAAAARRLVRIRLEQQGTHAAGEGYDTMTATETFVCTVCGETEEREELFEYCNGCGELYHFNRTSGPGKDCGDAWIEDEEVGLQFFCNSCMERQKTEDQEQMAELARAAAVGALTPELVARAMQAMGTQATGNANFAGNFPGLPQSGVPFAGMPAPGAGIPLPEPISAADLMGKLGVSPPSEEAPAPGRAEKASADAPPALRSQRKTARHFRRIE